MNNLKPNIDPNKFRINGLISGDIYNPNNGRNFHEPTQKKLQAEFDALEQIDPNKPEHSRELNAIGPKWLFDEANPTRKALFSKMVRYDPNHKTLVTGCYKGDPDELDLISCKHRRYGDIKWRTRAGTHPNNVLLIKAYSDTGNLFFVEGHHDALTALLLGLDFIMIPSSGYRCVDPKALQNVLVGRNVVFLVEDEAAYKCMYRFAEQIMDIAYSVTLKQLGKTGKNKKKVDLSDFVQSCSSQSEVYDGLYD